MSYLATVLLAWAAVYAYLCTYHVVLYWRRRSEREYLAFGLLTGGFAIIAVSNALVVDASTFETAASAVRLGNIGLCVALAFYVDFAEELTGRPTRGRLRAVGFVWALLGLGIELAGVGIVTERAEPLVRWGGVEPALPRTTWLSRGHVIGCWTVSGLATASILRTLRTTTPLGALSPGLTRLLAFGALLCVVAACHDLLLRLNVVYGPTLLDHAGIVFVFTMSYALLDRFVRASEELRAKTAELALAYEELRQTQERLVRREQLAAVGELSAVIAHEVRNPLAIIKNAVSGLRRRGAANADRATLINILDEEIDRLQRLVKDLLAFAQPVVPKWREFIVADLVRRVVERVQRSVSHSSLVSVEWCFDGPETAHGDPELLRHALVNVVENAFQAMPNGGTLSVRASEADICGQPAVVVAFSDTGGGMDSVVRAKARDPFFTTRPSGTGLGLAIVDRVLRSHGGRVEIESRHGEGTTIRLVILRKGTSLASAVIDGSGEVGLVDGREEPS